MSSDTKGALAAPKPPQHLKDEAREYERRRLKHAHARPLTNEELDRLVADQIGDDPTLLGDVAHMLCGKPTDSTTQ